MNQLRPTASPHTKRPWRTAWLWRLCLPFLTLPGPAAEISPRELLRDPHFQNGFILLKPTPGHRVPYGQLPGFLPEANPVWDLAQWSSRFALPNADSPALTGQSLCYTNSAKSVLLGPPGSPHADLTLGVVGSTEYANRARHQDEPWVHLLVQQNIEAPPLLADLASLPFQIEARLLQSRRIDTPDYTPSLHAAQFQVFLTVQNQNRQSSGYGQLLWFGIPLYDDRHRFPAAHQAQDTAGSRMFIFTPPGNTFTDQSAHDRQWISIQHDLLPLIQEGLATAWKHGFLTESRQLSDYRLTSLNLGWEVPGLFDVAMQIRDLSLQACLKPSAGK